MLFYLFLAYVACSLAGLAFAVYRRQDLEILPSLMWFCLISVPFLVQLPTLAPDFVAIQATGIVIIGALVMLGDLLPVQSGGAQPPADTPSALKTWFTHYRVYVILFLAIAALHLSLMPHIPLWEKYVRNVTDPVKLSWMREEASKLLPVGRALPYLFNWAVNIIAPIGFFLMIRRGKYVAAGLFLVTAVGYAVISFAQFPMYVLLASILLLLMRRLAFRRRLQLYAIASLLALPIALHAGYFYIHSPGSVFNVKPPPEAVAAMVNTAKLEPGDPRAVLTIGDNLRLQPRSDVQPPLPGRAYNYYVYRLFLGPVDVASRWYQYFPDRSNGFAGLGGNGASGAPGAPGAAQRVGNWAYTARFPDKYFETVHAYASVDADAYARFGVPGILAAGLLLLGMRLLLKWLKVGFEISHITYDVALVGLALLLPVASIQAILVPNGTLILLLLMLLYRHLYLPGSTGWLRIFPSRPN